MAMFDWIRKAVSANTAEAAAAPGLAESCKNEGNVHLSSGDLTAASACYRKAIEIDPAYAEAYNNLGSVLSQQDDFKGAIECCRKALALKPALVQAHINLGNALRSTGALAEALDAFHAALALAPGLADIHNNYAVLLHELGRLDEAIASLRTATSVEPWFAHAWVNLGSVLQDKGEFDEAEECFRRAIPLSPPRDETARYCLSLLLLTCGRLPEGWTDYDARFRHAGGTYKRPFRPPEWAGEDLRGRRLLIWGDQGVGDEIMFASMFGDAIARAEHCVVECVDKLVPLFARTFPGAEIVPRVDPPHPATRQHFDFQSSSGGLARWLRPGIESFPHHNGFLTPDARRVEHWSARLAELGPGLKVGICWRSRMRTGVRQLHYTHIDQWEPIFAVPGIHFINLQYDDCGQELAAARERFGVALHAFPDIDLLNDLDDAAALTRALDLVLTVPTAAGRLAASVGIPTWEMAYGHPWICLGTQGLPWFPAQRLFLRRWDQSREELIASVAKHLSVLDRQDTSAAEICKNRGNAHLAQGELDAAAACYREALTIDPAYAEAMNNFGLVLSQQGLTGDAIAWFEKALTRKPDLAQAHINLGNTLKSLGRLDHAAACFDAALSLDPDIPEARNGLGVVQMAQGMANEAIAAFRQAIALRPDLVEAHFNLGCALEGEGRFDEASSSFERVLALDPAHAEAHNNLGCLFKDQGRFEEAVSCFLNALAARPDHPAAMLNLGNAYREQRDPARAGACYEELLAIHPDNAGAWNNMGMALQDQGRLADAETAFQRSLAVDPHNSATRFYLSLTQLALGRLDDGWGNYEYRFFKGSGVFRRSFPFPLWCGEELADKSLLIWGDQGIGDEILFASQFREIAAQARRCIIECAPKLTPLFARSFPTAEIVPRIDPPHPAATDGIDFQVASGDLARRLRPSLAHFPQHEGYLVPDPERVAHWRRRMAQFGSGLRVGFCWRSRLRTGSRHLHYTSLEQWGPIFSVPGVHFINLQYDRCDDELAAARQLFGVPLHAFGEIDLFDDLDEAAALTGALDLVITAPTSAGRLAAAQGIPTWEICQGITWVALGTDHLPWLPSQRMFNRRWDQPWEDVIAAVAESLNARSRSC